MRRRKLWLGVWILLAVVVLAAVWTAWDAYHVNRDLTAAVDDAKALQAAVERGDYGGTQSAVKRLKRHSAAAADRTDGLTWTILEHAPVYGDDAAGVGVASDVLADLSYHGVEPLVQVADSLSAIVPSGGKIDLAALTKLQGVVASGRDAFDRADRKLERQDSAGFIERLRTKYRELARQVDDASRTLSSADTALQVLPTMLGQEGPRDYLLVFQNNAEIRATGGLPGAVSLVHAEDGKVKLTRQVAANSFEYTGKPILPLTAAEREIYDTQVGTFFLDANYQPDFSRASDLWKAQWEQVEPERIDGVVSLDPVAISYVLGVTGPITVDGVELMQENAVDELLHQVYIRHPKPADQDVFFRQVAQAFFDKVSGGVDRPQGLVRALAQGVNEHRIYVHAFDDATQAALTGTAIAGDLVTKPTSFPQVGVYLNDATGAKMSYYLRYRVDVDATYCRMGVQGLTGRMTLTSEAPENAAKSLPDYVTGGGVFNVTPGNQVVAVNIYGPVDGELSVISLNGRPITGFPAVDDQGRKVATTYVELKPQQKVDLTWRMKSGPDQTSSTRVSVTPSVVGTGASSVVASAC